MNLKISVIMPIYNAGKYLRNTLDSIINQSIGFENIELILVDDKSTDNSKDIIMEYSNKYSNIKPIFLEENTGCPGIPRNIGIENATSDYIMFIDNDDEYFPEICDKLYNTMIMEDVDVVVCNALGTDLDGTSGLLHKGRGTERVVLDNEIMYFDNVTVWNCIFKRSIILDNNISFVDGAYEDGIFLLEYFAHSKKLVHLIDFVGYHHLQRTSSTGNFSSNREIECINAYYHCVDILERNNCDLNRFFKNRIHASIMCAIFLGNAVEIKKILSHLSVFEKRINFNGFIVVGFNLVNFFILHGNINMATYICLFISKIVNSKLLLTIYRKLFLKIDGKLSKL